MSGARPAAIAVALGMLPAAAGCGGGGASHAKAGSPSDRPASPVTVRTADCRLWRVLDQSGRRQLVLGLRDFFGGPVDAPGTRGQVMPDDRADKLLTSYCRQPFASAFKLYRLYGNAAAFTVPRRK